MARYSTGANGTFPGKVGRVIGSNWRSVDYSGDLPKKSSKPGNDLNCTAEQVCPCTLP